MREAPLSTRIRLYLILAVVAVLSWSMAGVATAQESDDPAIVTVFHAVPAEDGFPADVYLDGELIIDGFVFEASSDSFELPGGTVNLEIYPEGADPETESPAVSSTVTLERGANYSVVAQISAGSPVITLFVNDTTGIGPGEARLTFRQTSAAPTLDVSVDDEVLFSAIESTNESTTELDAGEIQLSVSSDAEREVFDSPVTIEDGALTVLYAVGDPAADNFDILVQEVLLPQVAPTEVPSGTGGDKATDSGLSAWYFIIPLFIFVTALALRRSLE